MFNFAARADVCQRVSARANTLPWTEASQPGRREEDGGRVEKMKHQSCGEGRREQRDQDIVRRQWLLLRNASLRTASDIFQNLLASSHRHERCAVEAVKLMLVRVC